MKLVFIEKKEIASNVFSFTFTAPPATTWLAGQSIRIELPALDYGTTERRFSISSAPFEQVITITTRPSTSDFKQALFALQPGAEIDAYAIEGSFIWDQATKNPLSIAAGIGITPYHAMLLQRAHEGLPLAATLVHSGREANLPFASELQALQQTNPELQLLYPKERITAEWLADSLPDLSTRIIFLSGSSVFVDTLKADLIKKGIADAAIRCDWFTGRLPAEG